MSKIPPQFQKFMEEFFGDKRLVLPMSPNLLKVKIPLDSVFADQSFPYQGDIVYADRDSTGQCYVKFNYPGGAAAFPFVRNTAVKNFPIKELIVSNPTAQPGLFVNLWVGYAADIIPPTNDIQTVSGVVSVNDVGFTALSNYKSTTAMGINTPDNIFAAGSNTAGGTIHDIEGYTGAAAIPTASFLMKATAPASVLDGVLISGTKQSGQTNVMGFPGLMHPRKFNSGLRLDYISTLAEANAFRNVLYSLN